MKAWLLHRFSPDRFLVDKRLGPGASFAGLVALRLAGTRKGEGLVNIRERILTALTWGETGYYPQSAVGSCLAMMSRLLGEHGGQFDASPMAVYGLLGSAAARRACAG
jgi:hypothetical protein